MTRFQAAFLSCRDQELSKCIQIRCYSNVCNVSLSTHIIYEYYACMCMRSKAVLDLMYGVPQDTCISLYNQEADTILLHPVVFINLTRWLCRRRKETEGENAWSVVVLVSLYATCPFLAFIIIFRLVITRGCWAPRYGFAVSSSSSWRASGESREGSYERNWNISQCYQGSLRDSIWKRQRSFFAIGEVYGIIIGEFFFFQIEAASELLRVLC